MPRFHFDPRFVEIGYERMMLEQYVEMVEAQLPDIRAKECERIWLGIDSSDEADRQVASHLKDRVEDGVTTRFLTAAATIASWALYESAVQDVAAHLQRHRGVELRMSAIRGDFLERARTYFSDVLHFPLHHATEDWERLSDLAKIRHFLAHGNGDLRNIRPSDRPRLVDLVARTEGVTIIDEQYLVIDPAFAKETLRFLKELLNDLISRTRSEM
jgi:hypothetical protein